MNEYPTPFRYLKHLQAIDSLFLTTIKPVSNKRGETLQMKMDKKIFKKPSFSESPPNTLLKNLLRETCINST